MSRSLPPINITQYFISLGLTMSIEQILLNPGNKMILENSLDNLMKEIRREQFMNISMWKVIVKGCFKLQNSEPSEGKIITGIVTTMSPTMP